MKSETQMTTYRFPVIEIRVEPNRDGNLIVWNISSSDGTKASGLADSPALAMRNAASFVEAFTQPRMGGIGKKTELKVVS